MENIKDAELEFTYNLGNDFKIDIEAAKKRLKENKEEKQEESKKNFEDLKKQMEESDLHRNPSLDLLKTFI